MAKKSSIEKQKRIQHMVEKYASQRATLKEIVSDDSKTLEERYFARQSLWKLPRSSHPSRLKLRCRVSGRARSNYKRFFMSRIALRDLGSFGLIPGVVKSSW